ncbi:alpha/beta hydrolase [Granulicella sp. dw_53]|uniref:alpha/beta fold hydrolase n=1 Tax=Granulicella sp. dw_53 TaxID=2719792 RepID=UPI001BD39445|nr:alpha/beta hydrolase [Granulicella sp. dw_53]
MAGIVHRTVESNGIRIHIAEQGEGPLVLLCHGFPESWYSWRHQLKALAKAGFRAVAPDMRGYGGTDRPEAVESYTLIHHVGDMVGLVQALGESQAVIVGHDWGAPVAWNAALMRPDLFRGVVGLSVPIRPRSAVRPTTLMPRREGAIWYSLYFQEYGRADAEFGRDVRESLYTLMGSGFGETLPDDKLVMADPVRGLLVNFPRPAELPAWLSDEDLNQYTAQFNKTGFTGGLNWYRNMDRNWELLAPWDGAKVRVPGLYICGDRDVVGRFLGFDSVVAGLKDLVPNLRGSVRLPDCGHWTQQEKPDEVNAALIRFLREL